MPAIIDQVLDAQNETTPAFTMIESAPNLGAATFGRMLVQGSRQSGSTQVALVIQQKVGNARWMQAATFNVSATANSVAGNNGVIVVPGVQYRVLYNTAATDQIRVSVAGYFELVE